MNARARVVLSLAAAIVGVVALAFVLAGGSRTTGQRSPLVGSREREATDQWGVSQLIELGRTGSADLSVLLDGALQDPNGLLSVSQRQGLVDTLLSHAQARSVKSAARYRTLIEGQRGVRWIRPGDDWWESTAYWWSHQPSLRGSEFLPEAAIDAVVELMLDSGENRFVSLGVGDAGADIRVYRVRTEDQIVSQLEKSITPDELAYWYDAPATGAVILRTPDRSVNDILNADGSATVAAASILVRTESAVFNWHSVWYWDKTVSRWQCYAMARKGWNGYLFF